MLPTLFLELTTFFLLGYYDVRCFSNLRGEQNAFSSRFDNADLVEIRHTAIDDTPTKTINVDKVRGVMFIHHDDLWEAAKVHEDDLLQVGGVEIHDSDSDGGLMFYGQIEMSFTNGSRLIYFTSQRSSEEYYSQALNQSFWALAHVDDLILIRRR